MPRSSRVRPVLRPLAGVVGFGLALVLVSGCGEDFPGADGVPAGEEPAGVVSGDSVGGGDGVGPGTFVPAGVTGELAVADERVRFRPCGDERWRTLLPADADVGRELRELPGQLETDARPVVVHLVLQQPPPGSGDRIAEIRSAFPEGAGCTEALPDTELQARGNEPFWAIDVDGEQARVRTPEQPDGDLWVDGAWAETMDGWRFRTVRDGLEAADTLTLEIAEERCRDSMSGAWYPFSARARVGEVEWTGCALEGRRLHEGG